MVTSKPVKTDMSTWVPKLGDKLEWFNRKQERSFGFVEKTKPHIDTLTIRLYSKRQIDSGSRGYCNSSLSRLLNIYTLDNFLKVWKIKLI